MSKNQDTNTAAVKDEGTVDERVKQRILDARQRVDEREDYLYVQAPVEEGLSASPGEQDLYWGMVVKQFLRTIKPLLSNAHFDHAKRYAEEIRIGSMDFVPQDTDKYPFSQVAREQIDPQTFKTKFGLPQTADLPETKYMTFHGLESVLQTEGVERRVWTIETGSWSDPENAGVIQTANEQVVPKKIYEQALTHADEFLQRAGIGVTLHLEDYTGGEEPGI